MLIEGTIANYKKNVYSLALKTVLWHSLFFILALWRYFCVNRRYNCKNTIVKVRLQAFKPVLRHLPFFIYHFGMFFASIEGTIA